MARFSCSPDQACMFSQCDHCQHNFPAGTFDVDFIASGSDKVAMILRTLVKISLFTNGAPMMAN